MIFTVEIIRARKASVLDSKGNKIQSVVRYDSETMEVDVLMLAKQSVVGGSVFFPALTSQGDPIIARGHAPGSRILIDGKECG